MMPTELNDKDFSNLAALRIRWKEKDAANLEYVCSLYDAQAAEDVTYR